MALDYESTSWTYKLEVGFLGTTADKYFKATIPNGSGWKSVSVGIRVDATETYAPSVILPVYLDVEWGVGKLIDQGIGVPPVPQFDVSSKKTIAWDNGWTLNQIKTIEDFIDIPTSLEGQNRELVVHVTYRLPTASAAKDSTQLSILVDASLQSDTGAGTPPKWGQFSTFNSGGAALMDLLPIVVIGVVIVAGIAALGYASEKTGVNVGVLTGIGKSIGDGVGFIGGMFKSFK